MTLKIVIAGAGFAGFWAAVSAMRAVSSAGKSGKIAVILISPTPHVTIRPRLYEAILDNMAPDISAQLAAVGVEYLAGRVEQIDTHNKTLAVVLADGKTTSLAYDRFVLATGSQLCIPPVPGFAEYGFNVDTLDNARRLEAHLQGLKNAPPTPARCKVTVM